MIRFDDGPAKGQVLMLKRVARFLRVTEEAGVWDGLDQLEDTPRPGEKLYTYEVYGEIGSAFVDFSGKSKKASGLYPVANYRFVKEQPTDATMRDPAAWTEWCHKQVGGRNEL